MTISGLKMVIYGEPVGHSSVGLTGISFQIADR